MPDGKTLTAAEMVDDFYDRLTMSMNEATPPHNYRPIALTSTICKTLEKIFNTKLLDYVSRKADFGRTQAGRVRNRLTIDLLTLLDAAVRTRFVNGEHVIAMFVDIKKAYDLTWQHGIFKDLQELGL